MRISIIGDSSSSTIGEDAHIYPKILYKKVSEEKGCQMTNYAVPGITSSDAKSIYFSEIKNLNNDALIIYLGNNESAYGPHKGYCSHLYWKIKKIFFKKENYNEFFFLKDKFKFSYKFSNFSISNLNSDFKKNLESIIQHTKKENILTILINPIANRLFYSGAGAKNFEFFKLINIDDNISNILTGIDESSNLLIEGIKYHENKEYKKAILIYEKIIKEKKDILSLIAKNNLAVIFSEKKPDQSKIILENLLNSFKEYDPIIYYNLYLLEKKRNITKAKEYLELSYSKDFSLYRIQSEYRNTLEELQKRFNVKYLDLKNILNEDDFIDYCHPKKEAHKKIADNIFSLIYKNSALSNNLQKNFYVNKLVSPDYFNNPKKNFIDYYLIEKNISKDEIKNNLSYLLNKHHFDDFKKTSLIKDYLKDINKCYIINFIKSNMTHPIFTKSLLKKEKYLPLQNEIFSMPENYIHRIMYNYILFFEKNILNKVISQNYMNLNSKFYKKIILRNNITSLDLPIFLEENYQDEIEKKMRLYDNNQNKLFKNDIHNRLKTIIFWYTRESFRYGTLSRTSMLYNRFAIDRLMETLVVLITIEFNNRGKNLDLYTQILLLLYSLIDTHEKYANSYLSQKNFYNSKYDDDLNVIKKNFVLFLDRLQ